MNNNSVKSWLTIILMLAAIFVADNVYAASGSGELVIYHINDTHGRVLEGDDKGKSMGFAAMTSAVKTAKEQNPCTLWLDAGDTFHGMPIITVSRGENMVPILKASRFDALTPGNHDFNYGTDQLLKFTKELPFPVISANIVYKNDATRYLLPPYKIFNLPNGITVGVFGLSTPETVYKTNPLNVEKLEFLNPVEAARRMVAELRPKVDVIVALTHMGVDPASEFTSKRIAEEAPGIDIIIDGHSHTTLPKGISDDNTLIAQTGCYDHFLGRVTVQLTNHKITAKQAELLDEAAVKKINPVPDKSVLQILRNIEKKNEKILQEVVTTTSRTFDGQREYARTREIEFGDLITDAMRDATNADVAVINSGTIRAGLPNKKVTRGDLLSVFPFGNVVQRLNVDGETLREILEHSVAGYPGQAGGFLQVSGISFAFDAAKPAGQRVGNILVGGKPLQNGALYSLAITDFMKVGGDGYTMLKPITLTGSFATLDQVVADYLKKNPDYRSNLDRIEILNAVSSTQIIGSPKEQKQAA